VPKKRDEKEKSLESHGALHPHPESVKDEIFKESEFFDPRDLIQVRYEMLRRHLTEGRSVTEVVRAFGLSRQFFYRLATIFRTEGVYGLLPRKRGPKSPHKCSEEVVELAEKLLEEKPDMSVQEQLNEIQAKFQIDLHPRTLEKALAQRKKNRFADQRSFSTTPTGFAGGSQTLREPPCRHAGHQRQPESLSAWICVVREAWYG